MNTYKKWHCLRQTCHLKNTKAEYWGSKFSLSAEKYTEMNSTKSLIGPLNFASIGAWDLNVEDQTYRSMSWCSAKVSRLLSMAQRHPKMVH